VTKTALAEKLDRLDPGATLTVEQGVLASLFGAGTLTKEAVAVIEAFALDHRCTFAYEHGKPSFEKDDIF
jgi:hypothetical protein